MKARMRPVDAFGFVLAGLLWGWLGFVAGVSFTEGKQGSFSTIAGAQVSDSERGEMERALRFLIEDNAVVLRYDGDILRAERLDCGVLL